MPVAEVIPFPNSGTQKEKDEWWVKSGNETRMTNLLTKLLENDQYKQTIIDINKTGKNDINAAKEDIKELVNTYINDEFSTRPIESYTTYTNDIFNVGKRTADIKNKIESKLINHMEQGEIPWLGEEPVYNSEYGVPKSRGLSPKSTQSKPNIIINRKGRVRVKQIIPRPSILE